MMAEDCAIDMNKIKKMLIRIVLLNRAKIKRRLS